MGHVYFYNDSNAHQNPIWESVCEQWRAPAISVFLRMKDRRAGVHETGEGQYVMQGIHGMPPALIPKFYSVLWLIWNITNSLTHTKTQFSRCYWYSQDMSWWLYWQGVFVTAGCKSSRVRAWPLPEATAIHNVESSQELLLFSLS